MIRTLLDRLWLFWAWLTTLEPTSAHTPVRGASRDRSRHGKDRIRDRRTPAPEAFVRGGRNAGLSVAALKGRR